MSNRLIVRPPMGGVRRADSLGQLDHEFNHGPSPLQTRDVPIDLRNRIIRGGPGMTGGVGPDGVPIPAPYDLSIMQRDVHSIAGLNVLRKGLLGRVVVVTSIPSLIVQCQEGDGRGYLLLNPAGVVGLTAEGTVFNTQTVVGPNTVLSGTLGVANYKNAAFTIVATFGAGVGPVTFDLQTRDPVTDVFITTQTLASLAATGNVYINVGNLGIDVDAQILVTVPAATTITFSMGFILKDGLEGTSAGASQTIFFGGAGVNPVSGYPLLAGKERSFYFEENVLLYAVTGGPSLSMNIFEM